MLRVSRKLPHDVLQGCYSATEAVIHRLRSDMKVASNRPVHCVPWEHRLISRRASWTRPVCQQQPMSSRMLASASVRSGPTGRPCAEAARVEEPDQHDRAGDSCGDPAGSREGRGIAQQTGRQTCQQQSSAQRCQSAHDRPVAPLEPDPPRLGRPGRQLFISGSAHLSPPATRRAAYRAAACGWQHPRPLLRRISRARALGCVRQAASALRLCRR